MNAKAEAKESRFDLLKWLLVAVLVVVAVVGNQYFSAQPILYRVLGILVLAVIAAFLALQTAKGQAFFSLAKEARVEIRKVVWPSRPRNNSDHADRGRGSAGNGAAAVGARFPAGLVGFHDCRLRVRRG